MKGLCTVASGEVCTLLIKSGDLPEVGGMYYLECAKSGTQEQNKLFHALVLEYFKSGMHSYDISSFEELKNCIKKTLGAGFEAFVYVAMEKYLYEGYGKKEEQGERPIIKDAKTYKDIPKYIREDPELKKQARGRLKSWSKYSKKERTSTIDNLITEMIEAGVNTKKFEEIIKEIESE